MINYDSFTKTCRLRIVTNIPGYFVYAVEVDAFPSLKLKRMLELTDWPTRTSSVVFRVPLRTKPENVPPPNADPYRTRGLCMLLYRTCEISLRTSTISLEAKICQRASAVIRAFERNKSNWIKDIFFTHINACSYIRFFFFSSKVRQSRYNRIVLEKKKKKWGK